MLMTFVLPIWGTVSVSNEESFALFTVLLPVFFPLKLKSPLPTRLLLSSEDIQVDHLGVPAIFLPVQNSNAVLGAACQPGAQRV